ncbi:MAG: glycosyl transferase, partial [Bacteroidales bacterium]
MKEQKNPDYVFEVSWEVCNFIGGIYTVLSTKAKTLQKINKDHTIFIGPDLVQNNQYFKENATLLKRWKSKAEEAGFKVRVGRWNVPGKPIAIL